MKNLFVILIVSLVLFSCDNKEKSNKGKNESSRERDDYRSSQKGKDQEENNERNSNYSRDEESDKTEKFSEGSWSSSDVNEFVTSCVSSAVKEGMQRSAAKMYCECMQQKIEEKFPNSSDAATISDSEMEVLVNRLAPGCVSNK